MSKQKLIKKLSILYGIKTDYFDKAGNLKKVSYKECNNFLHTLGINTESFADLEFQINEIEFNEWNQILPTVQVMKQSDFPIIKLRISEKDINKTFSWKLEVENGSVHQGSFASTNMAVSNYKAFKRQGIFYQVDFPLSFSPGLGYHKFFITDPSGRSFSMDLIITPEKCYTPSEIKSRVQILGPKIRFHKLKNSSAYQVSDYKDLDNIISNLNKEKVDIIDIGPVNQFHISLDNNINPYLPSCKMLYNILYLSVDSILDYLEEKIPLLTVSQEYQDCLKELNDIADIDLLAIYSVKFKLFKLLYQSFREIHINNNTFKAQTFLHYTSKNKAYLRKLSLFHAINDYFTSEGNIFDSWHDWPKAYQDPESEFLVNFQKNNLELIQFYEFLQWQADIQIEHAGNISFQKGLAAGLCSNFPFYLNPKGSEAWLNQEIYSFKARITSSDESLFDQFSCPPILPHKLKAAAYRPLIQALRFNMKHTGVIKINDLMNFYSVHCYAIEDPSENGFFIQYPFEDIMSIIALESVRNRCAILTTDTLNASLNIKQAIIQYDILTESSCYLTELSDENDVRSYLIEINKENKVSIKNLKNSAFNIKKIPTSTYRLQFNKNFTFNDAKKIISYLKALGISHVYASPLLKSRTESTHGYDIVNHNLFNPNIGTQEEFYELAEELNNNQMGLILDIVPNHMGIGSENIWWMDVLENGPASQYSSYFDIDWNPSKKELFGKVLIPVLGDHYGNILSNGELKFKFFKDLGKISLFYYEHMFPLNPSSYQMILDHRISLLQSRLGSMNDDFLEYQSISTVFKNLPTSIEKDSEKLKERLRESRIAFKRLKNLCYSNTTIEEFISENLLEFETRPDDPISCNRLHNILEEQSYRLAYWRVSSDEINYRRFFDVNDLAALCMEQQSVFSATHNFILDLISEKFVNGIRLDHPDGLYDPTAYFKNLQFEASKRLEAPFFEDEQALLSNENLPLYVIAEKILAPFEKLPETWSIHGTVGYEFLNSVLNVFIQKNNEKKFSKLYQRFISKSIRYQDLVVKAKKSIMITSLNGELNVLVNKLYIISEFYYKTRDYTYNSLRNALIEIIAYFPVYRTYITMEGSTSKCQDYIKWAVGSAKKQTPTTDQSIYDFIEAVLIGEFELDKESPLYPDLLNFAMKFQQYTGPLMAKGLEDTSFYRFNRLVCLNEVGGEPENFGITVSEFHHDNINRLNSTPHGLLSSSTHDTKRSEDLRARISVLSEIPDLWQNKVYKLSQLNRSKKTKVEKDFLPSKNDEFLFYQTLVGLWPVEEITQEECNVYIDRIEQYMLKAIREAKVHSSWVNMNSQYENAVSTFIRKILSSPDKHPFWKEFLPFLNNVARVGYLVSLSQLVLKLTCPGVPDVYQGCELWNITLVDPDNRGPINYDKFKKYFDKIRHFLNVDVSKKNGYEDHELINKLLPLESGTMKIFLTSFILNFRQLHSELFKNGEYIPLQVEGKFSEHIIAFARKNTDETVIVVVPRLLYNLVSDNNPLALGDIWQDTRLILPEVIECNEWKNIFSKSIVDSQNKEISVTSIFSILPVGILYSSNNSQ